MSILGGLGFLVIYQAAKRHYDVPGKYAELRNTIE
jgi:hypothetical protein